MRFLFVIVLLMFQLAGAQQDRKNTEVWQYYYNLGLSSLLTKDYSKAKIWFSLASWAKPDEPKIWTSLGIAYAELGYYRKAEQSFLKALELDERFTPAILNLGVVYFKEKEYELALREIKKVLEDEDFSEKHKAYYYLAMIYKAKGDKHLYLKNLKKSVEYEPTFSEALNELAKACKMKNDNIMVLDVCEKL